MTQYESIIDILNTLNISFDEIEHEISLSCEHSAELRMQAGLEWVGSKNIIFHAKWNFYLVTTLWNKDIKARKFKSEFGTKDIRFASQDEITQIWLGVIGSIAPFGFFNQDVPIYVDAEIFTYQYFMFNPSLWTKTIRVNTQDLKKVYASLWNKVTFFTIKDDEIFFDSVI